MSEPILLTDEQMREFIVNGYLIFELISSSWSRNKNCF